MSPAHLSYLAMLVFCIAATVPLDAAGHFRVLRQGRRLALAIGPVALLFLGWDLLATHAGHWRFDSRRVLGPRLFGLPLEEVAFFVVIPLAALVTYEAVGAVGARLAARPGSQPGARPGSRR